MARNVKDIKDLPKRIQIPTDYWIGINKTGKAYVIVIEDRPFLARVSDVDEVKARTRKGARLVELVEVSTPEEKTE